MVLGHITHGHRKSVSSRFYAVFTANMKQNNRLHLSNMRLKGISIAGTGSRASTDIERPDQTNADDETVVDADQGNGMYLVQESRSKGVAEQRCGC